MAIADLITNAQALRALAAGGTVPTAAQAAHLADAIAAASRLIRRHCGDRDFTRTTYARDYRPDASGLIYLDQFPVNAVTRIAGGRTVAITITADATNQRATVGSATTGDQGGGLVTTGLTLSRVASGTTTASTLLYATSPTLDALATAANLLPTWTATVTTGLGSWPSSELIGGAVTQGALVGATLDLYAEDLDGELDHDTGILHVTGGFGQAWDDDRWQSVRGGLARRLRVTYDAGFDTIPADVQAACVEAVGDMLNGLATNLRLGSETVGNRTQVYNSTSFFADYALTKPVMGKLAPWRIIRA